MQCRIDVSSAIDLAGHLEIATEIFPPGETPELVLFCFPGGGCNRHYFNLEVEIDGVVDESYSFARSMVKKGFLVVTIDHLGVGDSSKLADGFDVTTERVVAANAKVVADILDKLHGGTLIDELPPLPGLKALGVGHSMGAMLAILQQDLAESFDALVLLGFGNGGVPDFLSEYGRKLVGNPVKAREENVELARQQFGKGYMNIVIEGRTRPGSSRVNTQAAQALSRSREALISVPAALSMVPDCVLEFCQKISVPVFIAAGDEDLCEPAARIVPQFPAAREVVSLELPETRHMHFVYACRQLLVEAIADWA